MSTLNKIVLWKLPSGKFNITSFFASAMLQGESEDDFIQREIANLISKDPSLASIPYFIKDKSSIRDIVNQSMFKTRHSVNLNDNGDLSIDKTFKPVSVKRIESIESVREKLKNSIGLTDDDIDVILGKST